MREWWRVGFAVAFVAAVPLSAGFAAYRNWSLAPQRWRVEMVSGGKVVRSWLAESPSHDVAGGVWSFRDAESGRLVKVSGPVILTGAD
jgi:hypothetical protein